MATQETKPGTLVFFCSVIYISGLFDIFGTRDLAGLNHKGFEDSKLSLKTAWASNNTWEHTSLCWDSLRLVGLKVETTRDSSTSSTEFPGRDIGKVEDQGWGQRHAELFGDLATQRVFFSQGQNRKCYKSMKTTTTCKEGLQILNPFGVDITWRVIMSSYPITTHILWNEFSRPLSLGWNQRLHEVCTDTTRRWFWEQPSLPWK